MGRTVKTAICDWSAPCEVRELNTGFSSFVVKFARRSANFAAHCCAKFAFYSLGVAGWLSMSPGFLVRADCNQNVLS